MTPKGVQNKKRFWFRHFTTSSPNVINPVMHFMLIAPSFFIYSYNNVWRKHITRDGFQFKNAHGWKFCSISEASEDYSKICPFMPVVLIPTVLDPRFSMVTGLGISNESGVSSMLPINLTGKLYSRRLNKIKLKNSLCFHKDCQEDAAKLLYAFNLTSYSDTGTDPTNSGRI